APSRTLFRSEIGGAVRARDAHTDAHRVTHLVQQAERAGERAELTITHRYEHTANIDRRRAAGLVAREVVTSARLEPEGPRSHLLDHEDRGGVVAGGGRRQLSTGLDVAVLRAETDCTGADRPESAMAGKHVEPRDVLEELRADLAALFDLPVRTVRVAAGDLDLLEECNVVEVQLGARRVAPHLHVHVVRVCLLFLLLIVPVVMLVRAVRDAVARIEEAVAAAEVRGADAAADSGGQVERARVRVVQRARGRRHVARSTSASLEAGRPPADRHDTEATDGAAGVHALRLRDDRTVEVVGHRAGHFLAYDIHNAAQRAAAVQQRHRAANHLETLRR